MKKLKKNDANTLLEPVFNDDKFISNVCLSYRHDFGLMSDDEQKNMIFECKQWMRAILNNWNYHVISK